MERDTRTRPGIVPTHSYLALCPRSCPLLQARGFTPLISSGDKMECGCLDAMSPPGAPSADALGFLSFSPPFPPLAAPLAAVKTSCWYTRRSVFLARTRRAGSCMCSNYDTAAKIARCREKVPAPGTTAATATHPLEGM